MSERYACPCCGSLTLPQPSPGTWEICPVCFWEDIPLEGWPANQTALRQAQRTCLQLGASHADWVNDVRPPIPAEARQPHWQTLDQQEATAQQALIAEITAAFQAVSREDGVTLHQARVLDAYGDAAAQAQARTLDTDNHWWEVPDAWIAEFSEALNFLDPPGFRYYIPAYLIWTLRHYPTSNSFTVDATLYAFCLYPSLVEHKLSYFEAMDQAQSRVICRFLRYCIRFAGDAMDTQAAQQALESYWGKFCPEA